MERKNQAVGIPRDFFIFPYPTPKPPELFRSVEEHGDSANAGFSHGIPARKQPSNKLSRNKPKVPTAPMNTQNLSTHQIRRQCGIGSLACLLAFVISAIFPSHALAGYVWSGGAVPNMNWANAYNWSGTGPRDNFNNTFLFGGTANLVNNNNLVGGTATAITFDTNAGAFVLGGNAIALNGDITNNSTNAQTINLAMAMGAVTRNVTTTAGDITLGGVLSGTAGITKGNTPYALCLAGANTFTGPVTIFKGILSAGSLNRVAGGSPSSNLGAPTTVENGTITFGTGMQSARLSYTGTGETTDRLLKFNGTGGIQLEQNGTGLLKFTGNTLTTSPTFAYLMQLRGSTAGTGEYAGIIANGSGGGVVSVSKDGNGTWTLSGSNTYTGNTTVSEGTLQIIGNQTSATGNVTVLNGGVLGGNGTVGGNVTFASGGGLVFRANPLKIAAGKTVKFEDFRIEDVVGLEAGLIGHTYTLIQGGVQFDHIFDENPQTAVNLGNGKAAYFLGRGTNNLQVCITNSIYADETTLYPQYEQLALNEIRPTGWILNQIQQDARVGLPTDSEDLLPIAGNFQFFRPAYDTQTWVTKNSGAGAGEVSGNWIDGFVRMAYYTGNAAALTKANNYITAVVNAAQANGGYAGNMAAADRYKRLGRDLFSDSRISMALLAYYELASDTNPAGAAAALDAVKSTAELYMANYTPAKRPFNFAAGETPLAVNGHSLMFVDVCEWLYRITGDRKYISYATFLYDDFSLSPTPSSDTDTGTGPVDTKIGTALTSPIFLGHGAHVAEHLRVPLFLAYNDTRAPIGQVATKLLATMQNHIVPSGAMVSCESVCGDVLNPDPFQGCEYCATTELATSLASAVEKTGQMKYADMLERLVFNAAQAARLQNGTKIAYLSSSTLPRATSATMNLPAPNNDGGRWQFSPAHQMGGSCCSGNAVKLMPYYVASMWMRTATGNGLAALHFGPSVVSTTVKGVGVTITEETEYPFSDTITFRIQTAGAVTFPLYIRIPSWAGTTTVNAPGATVATVGDTRKVTKAWATSGDTVTVTFQNPIRTATCPNNEVAVNRGPLLYVEKYPTLETNVPSSRAGSISYNELELNPSGTYRTVSRHYLEATVLGNCFTTTTNPSYNPNGPFSQPKLFLSGLMRTSTTDPLAKEPVTLYPIGSVPRSLRFAAFPLIP